MQVRVVDLNEVVREMTRMLGRLLGEAYRLELEFSRSLCSSRPTLA